MSSPVSDRGRRPVRIANFSGFYGDRDAAMGQQLDDPAGVDVLVGDFLSEITTLILARRSARASGDAFATSFLEIVDPHLETLAERGVKVVVNAGGLDPGGLADALAERIAARGVGLRVAHVVGDDLRDRWPELSARPEGLPHFVDGRPYSDWPGEMLSANAYLGAGGIIAALEAGADIVIGGRIADASLVVGAASWWWGWGAEDYDALAGAVAAGHVLECGTYATGGNFSGFTSVPALTEPGLPIAEIAQDGSCVITKSEGTAGAVTPDTVTAQLVYEIDGPAYPNPDVTAWFSTAAVDLVEPDRVSISGVRGTAAPPTAKVAVTGIHGWRNSTAWILTGLDIREKVRRAREEIEPRLAALPGLADYRFDLLGLPDPEPGDQNAASCVLVLGAWGDRHAASTGFSRAVVEATLAMGPGVFPFGQPDRGSARGVFWPTRVSWADVRHAVRFDDGTELAVPPPVSGVDGSEPLVARSEPPRFGGGTRRVPLGEVFHARSGDKGGNANVGIWSRDAQAAGWLAERLDVDTFVDLVPEAAGHRVRRFEMSRLGAVVFVIEGLLDGGGAETLRLDRQAKALGEWLRSRPMDIPVEILSEGA